MLRTIAASQINDESRKKTLVLSLDDLSSIRTSDIQSACLLNSMSIREASYLRTQRRGADSSADALYAYGLLHTALGDGRGSRRRCGRWCVSGDLAQSTFDLGCRSFRSAECTVEKEASHQVSHQEPAPAECRQDREGEPLSHPGIRRCATGMR